jgi:hypothetical protein
MSAADFRPSRLDTTANVPLRDMAAAGAAAEGARPAPVEP